MTRHKLSTFCESRYGVLSEGEASWRNLEGFRSYLEDKEEPETEHCDVIRYLIFAILVVMTILFLSISLVDSWSNQIQIHSLEFIHPSFKHVDSEVHLKIPTWEEHLQDTENNYENEKTEFEERGILQETQTKYAPPRMPFFSPRFKRDLKTMDNWDTYQGNETTDHIIWATPKGNTNSGKVRNNKRRHYISNSHGHHVKMKMKEDNMEWKINRLNDLIATTPESLAVNVVGELEDNEDRVPDELVVKEKPRDTPAGEEKLGEKKTFHHNDRIDMEYSMNYDEPETDISEDEENLPWVNVKAKEYLTADEDEERPESSYLTLNDIIDNETELSSFYALRKKQSMSMQSYMDNSVDPCEDFYQYACGNWVKYNPIPKDKAGFDTFEILRENLDSIIRELLEEPVESENVSSNSDDAIVKAKQLYQSCMNHDIIQERSSEPLKKLLSEFGGWPMLKPDWNSSDFDWIYLMAKLRLYNNDVLISEWIGPDIKYSNEYIIQFDQTTLGLPTREYFLQSLNSKFLEAYKNFLIKVANLLGAPLHRAIMVAQEIIDFEAQLAEITSSPDQRRNVSELYQRLTVGELQQMLPQIDWLRYLNIITPKRVTSSEPCVMFAMKYMQDLVLLLERTPKRTIANYLIWRFVRHRINNLDDSFEDAKQHFYYILFGREQPPPRWKNCVTQVNSNMGMAVGAMFVRKYFDENSKKDTLLMTEGIMQSFRDLLTRTTWLDDETKKLASSKVDAMKLRIGYPDSILDPEKLNERYYDVIINPEKYFENTLNILEHLARKEQNRLGMPVDKSSWNTAPAVVNAYYSRNKNQIMFPAGILQPPFYHRYFPRSLNFGGIGVVIGHEITHGFDDKGRLFDKDGNMHRWWHEEAIAEFHERAQCLIDQYSHYAVQEVSVQIDGMNTQGENIADNGGVKQAFRAYQKWLSIHGNAYETLPDFNVTDLQLFFINFAQVWCGETRPEAILNKLKTAVHAPGRYRVIGTLSNSEEFANVFNCEQGTPMNPIKKCSVW